MVLKADPYNTSSDWMPVIVIFDDHCIMVSSMTDIACFCFTLTDGCGGFALCLALRACGVLFFCPNTWTPHQHIDTTSTNRHHINKLTPHQSIGTTFLDSPLPFRSGLPVKQNPGNLPSGEMSTEGLCYEPRAQYLWCALILPQYTDTASTNRHHINELTSHQSTDATLLDSPSPFCYGLPVRQDTVGISNLVNWHWNRRHCHQASTLSKVTAG